MPFKRKHEDVDVGEDEQHEFLAKRERLQSSLLEIGTSMTIAQEESAVDDPGMQEEANGDPVPEEAQHTESEKGKKTTCKKRKLKFEEVNNMVTLECEWNMCTAIYKKMETFCVHITDHLYADCRPATSEGFLCIWRECGYVCSSKEELDRHVYFHAFHTKLKAIGIVFMKLYEEKCIIDSSGRNMIPEIPESFQCMWDNCNTKFQSAQAFYWHVHSHVACVNRNDKGRFACQWQGCSTVVKVPTRLSDHSRSHTQEKRIGCPNCGAIYADNTKFLDHYLRQTPISQQPFQCSHCSIRFPSVRLLRDHVRRHVNHFKCQECDMTCTTKATLTSHVRYRHSNERPHKCSQCEKSFKSVMDLNRHMSVHSEVPFYQCLFSGCSFESRCQSTLNKHMKVVHNGMCKDHYACHMCDQKFSFGRMLTKHLIKAHNFHWPSGHSRFRYKQEEDGFYRLQTIRYESVELTHEVDENIQDQVVDSPETISAPPTPASPASTVSSSSVPNLIPLSQWNPNRDQVDQATERIEKALIRKEPDPTKYEQCQQLILPSEY